MKNFLAVLFLFGYFVCVLYAAPADNKDASTNKDAKSVFGQAFDEIVVESHLTVRRKSNPRQGRTQNGTESNTGIIKTKREIKPYNTNTVTSKANLRNPFPNSQFGASAASAQSQGFNSFSPIGSFGASASSAQSQNFGVGPNGFLGSAGFSGTQQYKFNGQTIDIDFGNAFSGNPGSKTGGATITITGTDGKKRPLNG